MDLLLDDSEIVALAWLHRGGQFGRIAKGETANAHVAIGDAQLLAQRGAFGQLAEHLLAAVDPAGAEAYAVGGEHHRAQHEGAVLHVVAPVPAPEDEQDGGRAIVGVALHAHHPGVEPTYLIAQLFVLHCNDDWVLIAHAGGSPGACLKHGLEFFVGNLLGLEAAYAATLMDGLQYFVFFHICGICHIAVV